MLSRKSACTQGSVPALCAALLSSERSSDSSSSVVRRGRETRSEGEAGEGEEEEGVSCCCD